MVRQNNNAAPGLKPLNGILQRRGQHIELAVDANSQSLKNARERLKNVPLAYRSADDAREFAGCPNLGPPPCLDNGFGDLCCLPFFPVGFEQVLQFLETGGVHDHACIALLAPVHAHVEGLVSAETEPPARRIDLMRGNA